MTAQNARVPLAAVDVDLDLEGEPGLRPQVHETELGVDEVEVEMETPVPTVDELGTVEDAAELALEGQARLEGGEDADETTVDAVAACDGQGLLALWITGATGAGLLEVLEGPTRGSRQGLAGIDDLAALAQHEVLEVLDQDADLGEIAVHGAPRKERHEVTAKDEPVEARKLPDNAVLQYLRLGDHDRGSQLGGCGVECPGRRASLRDVTLSGSAF